jgi:acetylornithine deacetylase/succinyl-diaminopimelate desuccinylase-like protein
MFAQRHTAGAAEPDERTAVGGRVLAHYLEDHGIPVVWQEGAPGVPIFVATVGPCRGRQILFEGHLDVVPAGAGWTREPFTPLREENALYGHGTADMKAGIAAFALALVALQETGSTHGSVTLLAVPDEETGVRVGSVPIWTN